MALPAPMPPGYPDRPPRALAPPVPPPPPRREASRVLLALVIALVAGLVGAVIGVTLADRPAPRERATSVPIVRPSDQIGGDPLDVAGVVAKVQPSVVNVTASSARGTGVGTGVIISVDGEVVTNAHVVEGASTVSVRLVGETEPRRATVVATDPGDDLALLRIDGASGLTAAELALPDDIQVGDDVVAVGYALDLDGGPSVTKGIVSGLDRTLPIEDNVLDGLIQTDAAISSGNSGGPLLNTRGQVVGINTAVARGGIDFDANNIGFAISLREALPTVEEMRTGAASGPLPFLGVTIDDRDDGGTGALISEVVPDTPASRAGMAAGDIVVAVDGRTIEGAEGLIAAIRDATPGDTLVLEVERAGTHLTVQAQLVERDDD